jgi:hypothetical protein
MNGMDASIRRRRVLVASIAVSGLLLGAFVVVRLAATWNLDQQIEAAQRRAVGHAAAIGGGMDLEGDSRGPDFNQRALTTLAQAEVFDDPTVARVRVYDADGILLFATDQDVRPGSLQAPSEDPGVTSAADGIPYRSIIETDFTWSTVGGEGVPTELLQTFEPLTASDRIEPVGVVGVDFFMDDLGAQAVNDVDGLLTVIAIAALASLAVAVVAYRRTGRPAADDEVVHEAPQLGIIEEGPSPQPASQPEPPVAPRAEEPHEAEDGRDEIDIELAAMTAEASANGNHAEPPDAPTDPPASEQLPELEERVKETERMAEAAEERIAQADPLSPEAMALRERLAKTAARKKLGPSTDGD